MQEIIMQIIILYKVKAFANIAHYFKKCNNY